MTVYFVTYLSLRPCDLPKSIMYIDKLYIGVFDDDIIIKILVSLFCIYVLSTTNKHLNSNSTASQPTIYTMGNFDESE